MPALKMTSYRLIIELLQKYGLYKRAAHNKMENYYLLKGSRFQFSSLDDAEKIKSSEFNYIWMEEATEFTYNDYPVLLTRLSAAAQGKNQMFLTLKTTDAKLLDSQKFTKPRGCGSRHLLHKYVKRYEELGEEGLLPQKRGQKLHTIRKYAQDIKERVIALRRQLYRYVIYYNEYRPHQGISNKTPLKYSQSCQRIN